MIKIKPQNPKGSRDFLLEDNKRRNYIIDVLKEKFELYGFGEIYTPAFERLETLIGKYGEEGDKLLFKVLNSGNYLDKKTLDLISESPEKTFEITKNISSKGLRYDHTVPLARMVSQHQNNIVFPFKRYQIAPVWRADRPQKGRYQEFYQCDADIVGTKGLVADVELINMVSDVFLKLNLKVEIKINNRKIFNGICQECQIEDQALSISTILDKTDKIGEEKVRDELENIIGEGPTVKLLGFLATRNLGELELDNEEFKEGKKEINYIFKYAHSENLSLDLKLLRGLDYYTGTVLEVVSAEMSYGSICGGGRYDNLTEVFGLKDVSGIGISFGLDRVYDVMKELERFPANTGKKRTIIINLTERATSTYYKTLKQLRENNLTSDLYPTTVKMDKQLKYADKLNYDYAILIGDNELENNTIQVKDLKARKQEFFNNIEDLISFLKQ